MPHFRHRGPDHATPDHATVHVAHRRSGPSCRQTSALPAERGAAALEALEALEGLDADNGPTA